MQVKANHAKCIFFWKEIFQLWRLWSYCTKIYFPAASSQCEIAWQEKRWSVGASRARALLKRVHGVSYARTITLHASPGTGWFKADQFGGLCVFHFRIRGYFGRIRQRGFFLLNLGFCFFCRHSLILISQISVVQYYNMNTFTIAIINFYFFFQTESKFKGCIGSIFGSGSGSLSDPLVLESWSWFVVSPSLFWNSAMRFKCAWKTSYRLINKKFLWFKWVDPAPSTLHRGRVHPEHCVHWTYIR